MKKKILIFSLGYYPKHIGGAEVAIKEITDRQSPDEYVFHLIANRYDTTLPKVEQVGNVLVHRIGIAIRAPEVKDLKKMPLHLNKYLFQFLAAFKAIQLHAKYHYDGIWAMMAHSCAVPAAIFKFFNPKVPYLLTLQEGDPPEYIEKMMKPVWPLFKAGFTKAEHLQAISTFLLRWGEQMGFSGETHVIPNAVDVAHFTTPIAPQVITGVKQKIGKREGETWLITTSRLVYKNAIDDVIRALALLPESVHFLILGIGPDEAMLKTLAEERGVAARTHFHGFVTHKEIPTFYRACDIFIRPSRSEGMGNSFVEAMAADLPVIATQAGGIMDFLFDEKRNPGKQSTGWAVDADAPDQIADAVREIMANPEKVGQVTRTALALVKEKYDWNIIAQCMKNEVFEPLLERG